MKRLELDYLGASARSRVAVYILVLAAVASAAEVAMSYRELRLDIASKEARLALRSAQSARSLPAEAPAQMNAEEYAFARETVKRLSVPWETLFEALEAVQTDRVALLSIEPDSEARALSVTGEAKDYLGMLTYVANLAEQNALGRVHLVRHEIRRSAGPRPVAFAVSATWREER